MIVGILCLIQVNKEPAIDPDAKIALKYIQNSTTFKNNNVPNSLKLIKVTQSNTLIYPSYKIVEVEFDNYSDDYVKTKFDSSYKRNLHHHTAILHVSKGKVATCIIDGMWDEIAQKPLPVNSEKVAIVFISSCPTFRFDGVPDSIKVLSITREIFYAGPDVTVVELEFDCFYAGYGFGGRGGFQPLAHHWAILDVTDGKVTSANIDGIWDELKQAVVDDKIFYKYYSSPEEVRDAVVWYSINNFDWTLVFPAKWDSVTIQGSTGTDIKRYSSWRLGCYGGTPHPYDTYLLCGCRIHVQGWWWFRLGWHF